MGEAQRGSGREVAHMHQGGVSQLGGRRGTAVREAAPCRLDSPSRDGAHAVHGCQIASKRDPLSRPISTLGALRIWADECAAIRMRMRRRWCDGGRGGARPEARQWRCVEDFYSLTGGRREIRRGRAWGDLFQERFLNRQLVLPVSTISQWCVRRSSMAVVILASPNTCGQSAKARLVVISSEVFS